MTEDWNRFLSVVQTDKEGSRLNPVKVDGVDSTDEKVIGKRLQEIAKNATTGGLYKAVGELYGFSINPKNEMLEKKIPQLQEIAGKMWKKENELKQLKSELAALDRKIQLELAPPTPEVAEQGETLESVMSHINKEIKKCRTSL